jgi:hypothetical protein
MLFVTDRVSALTPFTDAELDALATAAHAAGRRLRLALLEQVAHWIADRWIDEVYAPCYRRPIVREGRCPRCDGFALGYVHVPYAAHLLVVERVDCDRCGAFGDRVGEPPERDGRLAVAVSEDVVAIRHCGHPNAEAARLVIRDAGVSREWPPSAGRIDLPLRALTKRGRLVLAGVRVADGWIAIEYHALFVAP